MSGGGRWLLGDSGSDEPRPTIMGHAYLPRSQDRANRPVSPVDHGADRHSNSELLLSGCSPYRSVHSSGNSRAWRGLRIPDKGHHPAFRSNIDLPNSSDP